MAEPTSGAGVARGVEVMCKYFRMVYSSWTGVAFEMMLRAGRLTWKGTLRASFTFAKKKNGKVHFDDDDD